MTDSESAEPQGMESVRTADAGTPAVRTETEAQGPAEVPNLDVRQAAIPETRKSPGPLEEPLEGQGGLVDTVSHEPATDPTA